MGLDTSHDAFHGAYSAFNRFRQKIASAAGGSFPPHFIMVNGDLERDPDKDQNMWYMPDEVTVENNPGLFVFMRHSDCDGEITPEECTQVADDLEALLPNIKEDDLGGGHIAHAGGFKAVTERFIAGCRAAATAGENLEFY